jgi:ATP-dependent exoDNAse (exonuclease V) alpha subunit
MNYNPSNWKGPPLSVDQLNAVQTILNSKSDVVFLCGAAGTGKSTVVNYLRRTLTHTAVTASTGLAAQIIQGRTIHSFAGIYPKKGAVNSKKANERMENIKWLFIDEGSMVDEWLLIEIFERCKMSGNLPKIILIGDFLQLPPVNAKPLYKSELWGCIEVVPLKTIHRQADQYFIEILNDFRSGQKTERLMEFVRSHTVNTLSDDCTHIMSYRAEAEKRNKERLNSIPYKETAFKWEVTHLKRYEKDKEEQKERDEEKLQQARFVEDLVLKKSARIMMLNNEMDGRWVNGSTGIVQKITGNAVYVHLDSGRSERVEPCSEAIFGDDGSSLFNIRQFPMQLAFGNTIHKTQGCTLDKIGINLNNLFCNGMAYVAVSRCRTANGIELAGELGEIKVDRDALRIFG